MTDKEIIIDGVNVSGCHHLYSKCFICTLEKNRMCKGFNNCYFKQLQRKIAECEELKEENQQLRMHFCSDCGEKDDYNIPCKLIRDLDYEWQKEVEENYRYSKVLDEIYEICRQALDDDFVRPVASSIIELIDKVEE